MAIPDPKEQKKQLRREMRKWLTEPITNSAEILSQTRDWLKNQPALKTIALYSPLSGEIDLTPLIAEFPQIRWVLPRVQQSELILHQVTDLEKDLEPGAFNIREPHITLPTIDFFQIDAFLCPGLAFDEYGGRLGRGRGFYDRMLENARPDSLKIGICRKEQLVPNTFSEPHDIPMDQVISA